MGHTLVRDRLTAASVVVGMLALTLASPVVGRGTVSATIVRPTAVGGDGFVTRVASRGDRNIRVAAAQPGVASAPRMAASLRPTRVTRQRNNGPDPLVASPPPPVQASTTANPAVAQPGVQGLSFASGPATSVDPPDPWVGVGPDRVVQAVNLSLRITDRSGAPVLPDISLASAFGIAGLGYPIYNSDPRVIYDALHGRWILSEVEWDCESAGGATYGHGYIDVLVSDTADPTGTWSSFLVQFNDYLPDYPGIGTSTDKVSLTANVFAMSSGADCVAGGSYVGADILVLDWASILGSGSTIPVDEYATSTAYGTPRAAVQAPATSPTLYVVIQKDTGSGLDVVYRSITGLVGPGGGTGATEVDLTAAGLIQGFVDPLAPRQPSGTVTTAIDSRPTDAIWYGNRLGFVSTQACTPAGDSAPRDCVRVSELDTSTPMPGVAQDFLVAETGEDNYFGGIGFNGNGALFVVWTQSSATAGDYPSSFAAYQLPSDAANSLSSPELLAAGLANHAGGRWGDYVGVAQDPQDPNVVWQGNEYATLDTRWGTHVSALKVDGGATYVPLPPVRILDSRVGLGLSGAFSANVPRTFAVAGQGGVPSDAVAVTGNLTVTQQNALGYVALTTSPTSTPTTSTLNFPVGDNRANNVTVALSPTGTLSAVYKATAGHTVHVIFDVTGYFLTDGTGATYHPVTPERILDSRAASQVGPYSTPFAANVPREVPVWGLAGVPGTATAITGNLTVTGQTYLGYLAMTSASTSTPSTSTLNFPVGDNRANGVSVALSATGSVWVVYKAPAGNTTHVVLDVTGYYEPGLGGLRYFPLNPGRALDGRPGSTIGLAGSFSPGLPRTLGVAGHLGVPDGSAAITGNLTVTQQTRLGFAAVTPNPTSTPSTSTLNFPVGDNRANGVTTPLNGSGNLSLVYMAAGGSTYLILDVTGYFR